MRVRDLGPIEAWTDGKEVALPTGKARALLALLLLHGNEVVSSERLIEDLWNGDAPATAAKVVQGCVSQLRRALGADAIATRGSGYALRLEDTDSADFERLVAQARGEEPAAARATLDEALSLWRGRAFADVQYETWAQPAIARLEELRLTAVEDRFDAKLALGETSALVPELEAFVSEHPLRERVRSQLMLALYREGRQADALAAYADARGALVEELGIEPGPELQELQRRILAQDPALGVAARPRLLAPAVRRARWVLAAGLVLVAGAVAGAAALFAGGSGSALRPNSVVFLDGRSGRAVGEIPVGSRPSQIAVGAASVWVLNSDDNTISQIDSRSRRLVATVAPAVRPVGVAASGSIVWLADGGVSTHSDIEGTLLPSMLTRVDPATRTPLRTARLPTSAGDAPYGRLPGAHLLAIGAGSIWAIAARSRVVRLDARTGKLERRFPIVGDSLAFGGGELWVMQQGNMVLRLDPRTNRVDFTYPLRAGPGIAYGFGSAWVADPVQGLIWRIYAGPRSRARTIPAAPGVSAVAVASSGVWAASTLADEVMHVDPATNAVVRRIHLRAPQDVAPAAGGVWVATGSPPPSSGPLPASSCAPVVYGGRGAPRFIVASDLALQSDGGASTRPIARGIEAVIRAHGFKAGKYTIGYQSCDDSTVQAGSFDWAKCIANARAYGSDRDVIGVVGTYNSGCATTEIPILNAAAGGAVPMVSPLNTDAALTIPALSLARIPGFRLYPSGVRNYARVIGGDQVAAAADAVLERQLHVSRVAVLENPGDASAEQLANWFAYTAKQVGLLVVDVPWQLESPHPAAVVAAVRRAHAGGVFMAAGGPEGGPILVALRRALPHVRVVATDWFAPSGLSEQFGPAADGIYLSFAGAPNAALTPAGRRFVERVDGSRSFTTAYGAAAAEVLLDAIARSDGTRTSVDAHLFGARVRTVLGTLRIDANGDPAPAAVTIFRVRHGVGTQVGVADERDAVVDRVIAPPARVVAGHRDAKAP